MRQLPIAEPPPRGPGRLRYLVLAIAVAIAALAGYVGYVVYPRFRLPPVAGGGLLVLASGAGVAAFFSPCSFPLLLTLLARRVQHAPRGPRGRAALSFAGGFSLGAVAFLALSGLLLGAGGGAVIGSVTFTSPTGIGIRIGVGVLLAVLGLIQAEVLPLSFHRVERWTGGLSGTVARLRRSHPAIGTVAFGFFYLVIGFG